MQKGCSPSNGWGFLATREEMRRIMKGNSLKQKDTNSGILLQREGKNVLILPRGIK